MNIRWTILLFLLFYSTVLSNAQDIHKTFYENGNVKEQGQFDNNGLRDGIWEAYYENGILWGIGKFH